MAKLTPEELVARHMENRQITGKTKGKRIHLDKGDNAAYLAHSIKLSQLGRVNMKDFDEVKNRVDTYFQICIEDDMKPSIAALALALGYERKSLWDYRAGRLHAPKEVIDYINHSIGIIDAQMNAYMLNGKINPVSGIFLMKASLGYEEKQELILKTEKPLGEEVDPEVIKQKYLESVVPIEVEATE